VFFVLVLIISGIIGLIVFAVKKGWVKAGGAGDSSSTNRGGGGGFGGGSSGGGGASRGW